VKIAKFKDTFGAKNLNFDLILEKNCQDAVPKISLTLEFPLYNKEISLTLEFPLYNKESIG